MKKDYEVLSKDEIERIAAEILAADIRSKRPEPPSIAGTEPKKREEKYGRFRYWVIQRLKDQARPYGGEIPYDQLDSAIRRIYPLPKGGKYSDVWQIAHESNLVMSEKETAEYYRRKRLALEEGSKKR